MHALATEAPSLTHRVRTRGGLPPLAWILVLAALAGWYVVLSRGGWAFDDNLYFGMARTESLGTFVNADLFGHWAVGYKLVFAAVGGAMPIDYRWLLLVLLLVLGASALLFARIIEMLVGGRWAPTLAAVYLAACVLLIRSMEWFSAGLQTVPTIAADLVCLWAYLRYQRQPAARWVVLSAAAIVAGLLFYEKALLMPVFILTLRIFVQSDDLHPRAIARAIWRERAIWGAYVAVLIGYVVMRKLDGAGSVGSTGLPAPGLWAQMYGLMWAKALVPAMFGLALPTTHVSGWQLAVGIGLELVVLSAIVVSIRRRREAWRAWVALFICLLFVGAVIAVGRLAMLGLGTATDPRYLVECAWLIPLFVCLAFAPRRMPEAGAEARRRGDGRRAPRYLIAAVAVASVGYLSASVATAANWEDGWQGVAARGWETNVESGLRALGHRGEETVIANGDAPGFILQSSFVPYNYLSLVLPSYGPARRVDGPLVGRLYTVSPSGRIEPARLGRVVAQPRPITNCGRSGMGIHVQVRVASPPPTSDGPYYALISYRTAVSASLPAFVDSGGGLPGGPSSFVKLAPAAERSIVWLGDGSPHQLLLSSPVGAYACVRSIAVVGLGAAQ